MISAQAAGHSKSSYNPTSDLKSASPSIPRSACSSPNNLLTNREVKATPLAELIKHSHMVHKSLQ